MIKRLLILTLPIFLSGCWDKVEIEDRGFVTVMGIDKADDSDGGENRFSVTMALPDLQKLSGADVAEGAEFIKNASGATVAGAMRVIGSLSGERLYFGHTKAVILGERLLKDAALFRETLDALERNRELSRNLLVLATTEDIQDVLTAKIPGEPLVGAYIAKFYKNSDSVSAVKFKQGLEDLCHSLLLDESAVIPLISLEGDDKSARLTLSTAAVVKDHRLTGVLNAEQTQAYMWFAGLAKGAMLTAAYGVAPVPVRIGVSDAHTRFYEEDGAIICKVDIRAKASVEGLQFSGTEAEKDAALHEISALCENMVADKVRRLFESFHDEWDVDGFALREQLRKQNDALYRAYGADVYGAMALDPHVTIEITGTGVIK